MWSQKRKPQPPYVNIKIDGTPQRLVIESEETADCPGIDGAKLVDAKILRSKRFPDKVGIPDKHGNVSFLSLDRLYAAFRLALGDDYDVILRPKQQPRRLRLFSGRNG